MPDSLNDIEDEGYPEDPASPVYVDSPADRPPGESPPNGQVVADQASRGEEEEESEVLEEDNWLLQRAQEIYTTSTDYLDANITTQWERNLSHFNNQHAPGSAYRRQNFKRSNVFRPKTRANVKSQEASMAFAAFTTQQMVDVQPQDKTNPQQIVSAKINQSVLQYRLSQRMPWFLTVQGAYQDTKNYGVCVTHQFWNYEEDTDVVPAFDEEGNLVVEEDPETGKVIPMGYEETVVRDDSLCCDNIPPENFRFDPMCDWRDPANSSPYLICMFPMYAGEVMEMMEKMDPKTGQPTWRKYALDKILSSRREDYSRTRQAREGRNRVDPVLESAGNTYTIVWVHMNIIRVNGDDILYWTLGTEILLTGAMRLQDAYPHLERGKRPFVVGFSNLEAHKNYPAGDVELAAGLQVEINDIANQRLDNVKLVLNKRHFVRRGAQVDLDALIRNVPGGGVMMSDPEKDVKVVSTPDITSSSYQEQDRLSIEMDEIVGGFSQSSVMSNRALNETVGGLGKMEQSASSVEDYGIRVFIETWMKPCLAQFVQLVQSYETDEVVLSLAAKEAGVWQRYGTDEITDELLRQRLTTEATVAIGSSDPARRIEKLVFGVTKAAELPGMIERIKSQDVSNEIFGALGYKDSTRFFMGDEEFEAAQAQMPDPGPPPEIAVKMQELQIRQKDNDLRHERELQNLELKREIEMSRLALEQEMKLDDMYARLGIEKMRNETIRDQAALREANKAQELAIKRTTGSGI